MQGRLRLMVALAAVATILLVGRALSALIVDQGWYAALGASGIWREKVLALTVLKGGAWLLGSAFVFANLWAVRRAILAIIVPARVGDLEFAEVIPARRFLPVMLLVAAMIGVVLTIPLDDWTVLSMAWRGERFAEYEGYFNRDLGFYVYWLPFETALYTWALVAIVVVTALVTVLYTITRHLRLEDRQLVAGTHVRRHLTALGALVLLLLAWSYRLDAYELLLWGSGFDGLFTRVDHRFTTRVDLALAVATFAAALIVFRSGWLGQVRAAFVTVTLVLVAALIMRQAAPGIAASGGYFGAVDVRDKDYEATRALFTRRAYHVDGMRFPEVDSIPLEPLVNAARSVVFWDGEVFEQVRGAADAPITSLQPPVWQMGANGPQAALVTRTSAALPVWDVRVVPGTLRDSRGAPIVARHRALGAATLEEPLIAPGFADHRVVQQSATTPRVPTIGERPTGVSGFADRTVAAAPLESFGARLAHAWATRDASLLRDDPTVAARAVVLHRDVRARVGRLVPTLAQGQVVAPIAHNGLLLWTVDLYSASDYYPLSMRFQLAGETRSYFRYAATAIVDAQTGRVRLLAAESPDPIARTALERLAPLIVQENELPLAIREQLPIRSDGAFAQTRAFTRVGSRRTGNASNFVPDSVPGAEPVPVSDNGDGTLAWTVPLVNSADQLVGVVEAVGGPVRETTWKPLREPLPRWSILTERLGTELDTVAAQIRRESDGPVTLGTLRVLVRSGRPLLVRPAYTSGVSGLHLTALAVATDSLLWAGATLDELLGVSTAGAGPEAVGARTAAGREAEARRLYDAMQAALREGDWLRFGATFDSLGRVLDRRP